MTSPVRDHLGRFGVWRSGGQLTPELAVSLEQFGFGTLWVAGSPSGDLVLVEQLLDATTTLTLATGIVNIWQACAPHGPASFQRIEARHPRPCLLRARASPPQPTPRHATPHE